MIESLKVKFDRGVGKIRKRQTKTDGINADPRYRRAIGESFVLENADQYPCIRE